jgi:arylsulfatase A-like enzyme
MGVRILLLLVLWGCGCAAPPDLILVVIDTLRADALPGYGAPLANAPKLAELSRRGVLFERVVAPSSWTKTSMASLLTGTDPSRHGVRKTGHVLSSELPTLALVLRNAGYRTLAVQGNPWLRSVFGFDNGFDRYEYEYLQSAQQVNASALELLEEAGRERPVFLYLHYMDVHAPYQPARRWFDEPPLVLPGQGPVADSELERRYRFRELSGPELDRRVRVLYEAELRGLDDALGALFDALRAQGRLDHTVLVVTSDHGEAFGEHGQVGHGRTLYPEVTAVPLLVHAPGRVPAGVRIDAQVRSIDVAPTLLALAGLPPVPSFEGEVLLPMEAGAIRSRVARSAVGGNDNAPDQDFATVVSEGRLYILERHSGAVEFYDLRSDPGARRNLGPEHPEAARFAALVAENKPTGLPDGIVIDGERRKELEALGYLDEAH